MAEAVWDRLEVRGPVRSCKTEGEVDALIHVMKKYHETWLVANVVSGFQSSHVAAFLDFLILA